MKALEKIIEKHRMQDTAYTLDSKGLIDDLERFIKKRDKEHKINLIEHLDGYSNFLQNKGYMDSDWYAEEPNTVQEYVKINNLW